MSVGAVVQLAGLVMELAGAGAKLGDMADKSDEPSTNPNVVAMKEKMGLPTQATGEDGLGQAANILSTAGGITASVGGGMDAVSGMTGMDTPEGQQLGEFNNGLKADKKAKLGDLKDQGLDGAVYKEQAGAVRQEYRDVKKFGRQEFKETRGQLKAAGGDKDATRAVRKGYAGHLGDLGQRFQSFDPTQTGQGTVEAHSSAMHSAKR